MAGASRSRLTLGQRLFRFGRRFDDGAILRAAFYGLLVATIAVIFVDFREMQEQGPAAFTPESSPIPPSVERPELDPQSPAYNPGTRLSTPSEKLRDPLSIELGEAGVLRLTGTIQPGSAERLETELEARGEYVRTVALDSPGGVVHEALAMGRLVRDGGYGTSVANGAMCASSCPLVLAGGATRTVKEGAAVGVHQIYTGAVGPGQSAQALSDAQVTTATIARYLDEMGVEQGLWLHALETPPDRLYYFTAEEMARFNLSTGPGGGAE